MKQSTKNILMFIGGFIWAMKTTTKAYAPTIIHKSPKKPKSQDDCEDRRLYREGEWIGETLTDNRCVETCDIGEEKKINNQGPAPGWYCEPKSTRVINPLVVGDLVKMCTVSTCGKCYCGTGQQAFMKILSISGCDYQLEVMNNNDSLTGNPLTKTKGHIYNWNDRNCSSPGILGAGGLVKLNEIEKANLNSQLMLVQVNKCPKGKKFHTWSHCGNARQGCRTDQEIFYIDTYPPNCAPPQPIVASPQSQADCGQGLVFYQSYPCGIPGCAWNKECITPAEKILRQNAPLRP